MKNLLIWIIEIILYTWQLPQNIIGLLVVLFTSKKTVLQRNRLSYVIKGENFSGGISLGSYIVVSRRADKTVINHELGHRKQSQILGILYLLVIGIPSIIHAMGYSYNYYDFYTEKWADKLMKIKR